MTDRARLEAAKCLVEVEGGAYSNLALKKRTAGSDARSAAFCSALVYGTLERLITLDYLLGLHLKKGTSALDPEVRAVLRMGLYQCLYMDGVPARAAVNESVNLCRALKKTSAGSLVNAVLRRASAAGLEPISLIKDSLRHDSVRYSLCEGLVGLLCSQYGGDAEGIMAGMLARGKPALRVNALKTSEDEAVACLAREGVAAKRAALPGALVIESGDYMRSALLADGRARVQSLCAQAAVYALAPQSGDRVLDMCSAPGGKALTAAQLMGDEGEIAALDIHSSRLRLIEEAAEREGIGAVRPIKADARFFEDGAGFDRVLCDVPCSGYGEIYTKPELRLKNPDKTGELLKIQRDILNNAASLVKKGGRLVYSTCTVDRRENDLAADGFLALHGNFRPVPTRGGEKYRIFLPGAESPEGFFIATFERMW